jgi:hypothetical protein
MRVTAPSLSCSPSPKSLHPMASCTSAILSSYSLSFIQSHCHGSIDMFAWALSLTSLGSLLSIPSIPPIN